MVQDTATPPSATVRCLLLIAWAVVHLNSTSDHGSLFGKDQRRYKIERGRDRSHDHAHPPEETSPGQEPTFLPASATPHRDHHPCLIVCYGRDGVLSRLASIFITCYRIHRIMSDATALWWKAEVSLGRAAKFASMKSNSNPRAVVARFAPWDEWRTTHKETVLVRWRDNWVLQGCRIYTLSFYGPPSYLPRFPRIPDIPPLSRPPGVSRSFGSPRRRRVEPSLLAAPAKHAAASTRSS